MHKYVFDLYILLLHFTSSTVVRKFLFMIVKIFGALEGKSPRDFSSA